MCKKKSILGEIIFSQKLIHCKSTIYIFDEMKDFLKVVKIACWGLGKDCDNVCRSVCFIRKFFGIKIYVYESFNWDVSIYVYESLLMF